MGTPLPHEIIEQIERLVKQQTVLPSAWLDPRAPQPIPPEQRLPPGWHFIEVSKLKIYPPIKSRCALYELGIPVESTKPQHLEICRERGCGGGRQPADRIKEHARILEQWATDPLLKPLFQEVIQVPPYEFRGYSISTVLERLGYDSRHLLAIGRDPHDVLAEHFETSLSPLGVLDLYFGYYAIKIDWTTMGTANGRHRICAARKFGVAKLWVWVE